MGTIEGEGVRASQYCFTTVESLDCGHHWDNGDNILLVSEVSSFQG